VHDRVPVIVVAGYLGSGKTTMLNHWLTTSRGTRIGVVVNDFGAVNIDALTVAGQVDAGVSLANGCLCCAVDASGLDKLLDRLAGADLDAIVIEASGLAEPRDLVRLVLASARAISYGGLVEVVDAVEFEATRARHPELDRQLAFADLVVLNKTDRVDPDALGRVRTVVDRVTGGRPVLATSHGRVPLDLLLDPVERPVSAQLSFDDLRHEHDEHLHTAYESVEFVSEQPLHPRRFMRFLDERPAGLYRAKGFVHFGLVEDRFALHTVGRSLSFRRSPRPAGAPPTTSLVLIGSGLAAGALRAGLAACVEPDPASIDENALLRVLRHTT
jgi:G3E family GTPase